ncbi:FERM, ARHGEF and pleckstrin domain-containing protein 2-like [Artemia franciscana]|uniref:FERM, ARHGEF and pleckstrin domain-containing protein 2-like n=1 Tax=Artemia franciscana TaxID=6661 RepID=UPI0032DA1119
MVSEERGRSHSASSDVDGTLTGSNRRSLSTGSGKVISMRVQMLDDSITLFQIQTKAIGQVLFDQVCRQLSLLESDYFGLEYQDTNGTKFWLDLEKPICRQLNFSLIDPLLRFVVKFYTPDPTQLEEEFTRYLFGLQIKRDLAQGILHCHDSTSALLASYIVQAECGDFASEDYPDSYYLSAHKFVPHQDIEMEKRIMENHRKHIGQTPAEADLNLLETARRCELYGVRMHPAKDHEGVPLSLAVAHQGVCVFQQTTKINLFSWAKIRKLSFKRKKFLIKLHADGSQHGFHKDMIEFAFEGRNECKSFWKKCVEHHAFFRCINVKNVPRQKAKIFSRGSSFRYSGRTQKQIIDYVRENYVRRQSFQRSQSFRHTSPQCTSSNTLGNSNSLQPLVPVINETAGSLASMSLGHIPNLDNAPPVFEVNQSPHHALIHHSKEADLKENHNIYNHSDENLRNKSGTCELPEEPDHSSSDDSCHAETPSLSQNPAREGFVEQLQLMIENSKVISGQPPNEVEIDTRRRRFPSDKSYFIAKEVLMTERTYKKDLETLNLWFRDEVSTSEGISNDSLAKIFELLDPIYDAHCLFLKDLEQRISLWEGRNTCAIRPSNERIGDVILKWTDNLKLYESYISEHGFLLEKLEQATRNSRKFDKIIKDFESQKVCYLPLMNFFLKPLQRILHIHSLLERLLDHYSTDHMDHGACTESLQIIRPTVNLVAQYIRNTANFIKLSELQRDLIGLEGLAHSDRIFIREGCLNKLSRRGFQPRIFFLFSDAIVYASRSSGSGQVFRVHGYLPLRGISIEETEPKLGQQHIFTIFAPNKSFLLAASSEAEKNRWLEDLLVSMQNSKDKSDDYLFHNLSLKSQGSDEALNKSTDSNDDGKLQTNQPRSNSTAHVCWHRNTSVGSKDLAFSLESQLSGYLLRKFKTSNGWQKLWVVLSNFCLFFYKTYQEDFPLASLPLLGYIVSSPGDQDHIHKDYVFKLQFKSHVYFFRAESEFTFNRWLEVISRSTQSPTSRLKLPNHRKLDY